MRPAKASNANGRGRLTPQWRRAPPPRRRARRGAHAHTSHAYVLEVPRAALTRDHAHPLLNLAVVSSFLRRWHAGSWKCKGFAFKGLV